MIPTRGSGLKCIFRAPRRAHGLIGLAGGGLGTWVQLFQFHWTDGARLSFLPMVIMLTQITGGWAASLVSIVTLIAASMTLGAQPVTALSVSAGAVLCGILLWSGVRPVVAVLSLTAVMLLSSALVDGVLTRVTVSTLAVALLAANANIGLSAGLMTLLPRRSAWLLPQRRTRFGDVLYVVAAISLTAAALAFNGFTAGSAAGVVVVVLGVNLTVLVLGVLARRKAVNLLERLRTGRQSGARGQGRARYASLPFETALLFLGSLRESDRLHRLSARQGLHLESARRRLARLQDSSQNGARALRAKHKELANALAANTALESKWRAFLETFPDALLIADATGRIEFANGAVQSLLGRDPDSLLGTQVSALLEPATGGELPHEFEPLDVSGDPEPAAQEMNVRLRDAQGVARELTARVKGFYIQAQRRLAIRLSAVSAGRYLARATEVASQRAQDQLIATMSHEIRTPLHGLMATLDMLRSEAFSPEGRQRLAIARTSAKMLINIANDILDLSRISAGGMPLERKALNLGRLMGEVVDEASARAESMRLTVRTQIDGELPPSVLGDPIRIRQILNNLVANALKFTSAGSVTLRTSYTPNEWIVDVIDTGTGVPEDQREAIFEPFVQADSESSRRFGGAGLGLPISRKLCEAMGGSLVLEQTGHFGSTFRVALPLPISDEPPADENSQRILQVVHGHVLVVEDDQASRYVAQTLLESLQCPAHITPNGVEALELLQTQEFDLVLMDCEMPELDGYETTRRARKVLAKHIPIVAMTAGIMAADRQRCFDAGMDDILPKPFSKAALNDMLCKWLSPDSAAAQERTLAQRVAALPVLEVSVFEELQQSLQWRQQPLRKLYGSFRESTNDAQKLLLDLPGNVEEALAVRRLHSLQGSAGLVGARQIEHLAAWLTEAVKRHEWQAISAEIPLVRESLRRFQQELDERLNSINAR